MTSLPAPLELLRAGAPSLEALLRGAGRAAGTEAPILILGEPGTGRSALARAIHASSRRRDGPLIEVDPGAIPATLFESDFFGFVAGAFTGAERDVLGRVARAAGGSLSLDHVEEIPLPAQPKLLRLLAEARFAPLGGREIQADVRFLAIGAADLEDRVAQGRFRRDLYHRLEVVTLRLPPLRERPEDLEPAIRYFLEDLAERSGSVALSLTRSARDWMLAYDWPGNLRELRNVLERAAVLSEDGRLDPPPIRGAASRPASLAEVEREQIVKTLAYTRGHQGKAAELLGISRKALWEKRKRYGLP